MAFISFSLVSFLCYLLFITIFVSQVSSIDERHFCDKTNDRGNYTPDSTYHTNLNTLLSTLTSNKEIKYGFYNLSYGQYPDQVYAIGLCRGDIKTDNCLSCLNKARVNLTQLCANRKEAIGWYDDETCMLRYSDRLIFEHMENGPAYYAYNEHNATNADQFNKDVKSLLSNLTSRAASGDFRRKYATSNATGPNNETIYGLVQCTPDLSAPSCSACVNENINNWFPSCCENRIGARAVRPSCYMRYESNFLFYDPAADAPLPALSTGKSNRSKTAIAIAVPVVVVVVVLSFIYIYLIVRKRKPRKNFEREAQEDDNDDEIQIVESLQFNFDTIRDATNDFSDSNKLGQGGFGAVYRGKLDNGQEIAVKRLSRDSSQGDIEFKNEVLLVAKLQHRNLVRLLGFCLEGRERLLVYEFITNKSLDHFIFDPTNRAQLGWETRYKIIGGIARGILYLHEDSRLRIIHRDLKASNILLDEEMRPKISDFGLARMFVVDQTQGDTNRIVGTYGYMAPEYALHGQFSVKSDIFSFGVLVLEIVSGRKSIPRGENMDDLLSFAWRNWRAGTITDIVDPTLSNGLENEIMRCIHIGLLCVQENVASRPTMGTVVLMLNSYSISLAVPSKPAFYADDEARFFSDIRSSQSTNRSAQESVNEVSNTELYPR